MAITTRCAPIERTGLAAIIASIRAAASTLSLAAANFEMDPVWFKLVTDFRAKHAAWLTTIDLEEEVLDALQSACAALSPEPMKPEYASDGDILDKTLRELRTIFEMPEHTTAQADYKRDHADWNVQRDTLREQVVGPAKAASERTFALRSAAFDALTTYRVSNLCDLGEKIEIILKAYEGFDVPPECVDDILADVHYLAEELR